MNTTNTIDTDSSGVVAANNKLGFELLSRLVKNDVGENVFVSSFSVAIALAMTYNGAENQTKEAMADALGVAGLSLEEINTANAAFMSMQDGLDPKVELAIANSIWARLGIVLARDFIRRISDHYAGAVNNLDFGDPSAAETINRWVSDKTHERIRQLVTPPLVFGSEVILVNAIYFKGIWTTQFAEENTKQGAFTLLDGSVKSCPMMSQSGHYEYYETETFQAVSLPYGERRVSMYVFLPKPTVPFRDFQTQLSVKTWQHWVSQFRVRKGDIVLPRFKLEYGKDILSALVDLGGGGLAGPDFLGMGAGPLVISHIILKTFLEINEEGTEAAAATAVVMARSPTPRFSFEVDRPFFCAIRDNETGALLFMGYVVEPN